MAVTIELADPQRDSLERFPAAFADSFARGSVADKPATRSASDARARTPRLREIAILFLKLGTIAFGGPWSCGTDG